MRITLLAVIVIVAGLATVAWGDQAGVASPADGSLPAANQGAASQPAPTAPSDASAAPAAAPVQPAVGDANPTLNAAVDKAAKQETFTKGPPLPFQTIEGYGGGAITPMAYLVNPGPKGQIFGLPAAGVDSVVMGKKNLQAFMITETLFDRVELGYGIERLGLGSLPHDIKHATGIDINRDDVWLHNFNVRTLLVEENSFGAPLPAITFGTHFKLNDGISDINNSLHNALGNAGYRSDHGIDFTLTATKTFVENWTLKRPLILSAGVRNSNAAQIGFLGFGEERQWTFEGSAVYLPTDWLLVGYEFRGKKNPYHHIGKLVQDEDNWQAVDVSWLINKHCTLTGGWGIFGTLANSTENGGWFLQFKYEF